MRRKNAERVQFIAENEERELFIDTMEHLDVRPLGRGGIRAGEKSPAPADRMDNGEFSLPHDGGEGDTDRDDRHPAAADAPPTDFSFASSPVSETAPSETAPMDGRPLRAEGTAELEKNARLDGKTVPQKNTGPERSAVPERSAALDGKTVPVKAKPEKKDPGPDRNAAPGITRFETPPPGSEDEHPTAAMEALMENLMAGEEFDPSLKFAGATQAPRPPPRGRGDVRGRHADDVEPDEELDLHGKTQEEAIRMVQNFLLVSHRRKLRHVLIITGKGNNSGQTGPVLGPAVFHWLDRNGDRYVRDFIQAPPRMGGAGAIWITLR